MKSTEEQVAELEGRVAELEKLTDELKDVCLMSRTNNVRLTKKDVLEGYDREN